MANIVVTDDINQYILDLTDVITTLCDAYSIYDTVEKKLCDDSSIYKGRATNEMTSYFNAQKAHLQKLIKFYQVAAQFATEYIQEMTLADQNLGNSIDYNK